MSGCSAAVRASRRAQTAPGRSSERVKNSPAAHLLAACLGMATDTGKAGPTDLRKPNRRVESCTVKFAVDLYGAFPVKRLFWVVLRVFCSERERPFFVPSPAIRSPERAEGVKGPKR